MKKYPNMIRNVVIIEPAVSDKIKVSIKTLLCEPVDSLDDLLFWEEKLESYGKDYVIAEFVYGGKKAKKRVFGIFTEIAEWENQFSREDMPSDIDDSFSFSQYLSTQGLNELAARWGIREDNNLSEELNAEEEL